ncbi:hypothetical protein C8J57DRAFT_1719663 [Mycena rebaudengoi]|nr:hypothetical protein C8J57DRAFT_1719663 [Mycena rebaudengoi]
MTRSMASPIFLPSQLPVEASAQSEAPIILPDHRLLHTNEPPTALEAKSVNATLAETRSDISCIEEDISRLRIQLQKLQVKHDEAAEHLTRTTGVFSPLRILPPEILCQIFLKTLSSPRNETSWGRFDVEDSPWVLGHVCSRWRAIARECPALWSQVTINFSELSTYSNPSALYPTSMFDTQLLRAEKLNVAMRWETLDIRVVKGTLPLLADLRDSGFPVLRRLRIKWIGPSVDKEVDCFRIAPSLRYVIFFTIRFTIHISGHQITRYQLDVSRQMHLCTLRTTPNLIEARIFVTNSHTAPEMAGIELAHLRVLYVSDPDILDHLTLPVLEDLRARCRSVEDGRVLPAHLESVLPTILRNTPSIVEFRLMVNGAVPIDGVSDLMSALTIHSDPPLAPHPRAISVAAHQEFSCAPFLDMLESRWKFARANLEDPQSLASGLQTTTGLASALLCRKAGGAPCTRGMRERVDKLKSEGLDLFVPRAGGLAAVAMNKWMLHTYD